MEAKQLGLQVSKRWSQTFILGSSPASVLVAFPPWLPEKEVPSHHAALH